MTHPVNSGHNRSLLRTAAWTLGAIVPWATMAAAIEYALESTPSSQLLFWVFLFATPATFIWARCLGGRPARSLFTMPLPVLLIGLLGIFGWTAGVLLSLDRAPVIEANLLTYLWPLLLVIMAPMAGSGFSWSSLAGAMVGFAGAALVVTGGEAVSVQSGAAFGYFLALAGALAWAIFVILLQRQGDAGTRRTPVFVLGSFVCSTILAFSMDGGISVPSRGVLLSAAWLGIAPLSLAFVCWDRAVTSGHLALVGRLSYFDPLLSTLLLMLALGLMPTQFAWIGMAMIIAGVALPELWEVWRNRMAGQTKPQRRR